MREDERAQYLDTANKRMQESKERVFQHWIFFQQGGLQDIDLFLQKEVLGELKKQSFF